MPRMLWRPLGRQFQISRRKRSLCRNACIARSQCPNPAGTVWIVPVSFGARASFQRLSVLTIVFAEEKFICDDCEYKCLAFNEVHTKKHILVRVTEKVVETVVSTEDRLRTVEGQLESVKDRLQKMEVLLSKLLPGNGPNGPLAEALGRPEIQAAIVELRDPELGVQEVKFSNRETTSSTGTEE